MFNPKKQNAFTLAEIFIAMVILSVLVAVCMTFFVKRHDYEREYFFYSAYKNIVNVVDSALMNEAYLYGTTPRVVVATCGTTTNPKRCRAFNSVTTPTTGLCSIFKDYFNTVSDSCSTVTSTPATATTPALKLTNGMEFHFNTTAPIIITDLTDALTIQDTEQKGYTVSVDINGHGFGEDKMYYDVFSFYVTLSGKVLPLYGQVSNLRGYEYIPATMDAGGNPTLAAFDVVYSPTGSNYLTVIGADYHSVPFPKAACAAGYIPILSTYCAHFKFNCDANGNNCTTLVTQPATCTSASADCKIRLVQKLKRLK